METTKLGVGLANGKIILMGEHAVVYGEPAIALPFKVVSVIATVEHSQVMEIDCRYFSGKLSNAPAELENITESIRQTLAYLEKEETLKFTISSTIPPERGMGSSAAVAVAVIRSIFSYYNYTYREEELSKLVEHAERIAHGNPSGVDAASTSGENPLFFIKGKPLQSFPMNLTDTYLIVADTGIKGKTREAVAAVAQLLETNNEHTQGMIHQLGNMSIQMKEGILTDKPVYLGELMTEAQTILEMLTVSHPLIDRLVKTAISYGALGAKLTGGGRGGCVIALADDPQTARTIAKALRRNGAVDTWIQKLGVQTA